MTIGRKHPATYTVVAASLLLFTLTGAAYVYASGTAIVPPRAGRLDITSCGVTPTEAHANGCRFDVTSFSWLPPACYDEFIVDDFIASEPREWFLDPSGTRPVPLQTVQRGDIPEMYVSWGYHKAHCVSMWKKMHRAVEDGRVLDAYIGNYNHTSHCGHMLTMAEDATSAHLNTIIRRKFVGCGVKEVIIG
ncbi:hypothetical protein CSOJ01_15099 [Colletotrichum sojae]|uniref:Uncharacterized protein n=1 Tax=Colletotrichum sojae TaxID=2175907 RepID=A0A8H6MIJ2_9PEZI|nr:hypothetical protein CSOJ01_15099 [Colletotrichum sojae]